MSVTSYFDKRIKENNEYNANKQEHIDSCKFLIKKNKKRIAAINDAIKHYFQSWGVKDISDCNRSQASTITALMRENRGLRSNNISLDNSVFSGYLAIFNTTLDNSDLMNQKMLFEHLSQKT